VDEHAAQINTSSFADPEQSHLAAGRVLSRNQTEQRRELASFAKRGAVADGSNRRGRHQRPHSGDGPQPPAGCIARADRIDLVADGLDLRVQRLPLLPEMSEHAAHARRQILVGIFQNRGHLVAQVGRPFGERDAALQQESADLVDKRRPVMHQAVAHAMQRLQVELVIGLDRHETHVLARHRLRDRLGIEEVVLVRLEERFYELRGNEAHVVALVAQRGTDEVCARTGLNADQRPRKVRRVNQQLLARELLPHDNFAVRVQRNQVKGGLAQINADGSDLHLTVLRV